MSRVDYSSVLELLFPFSILDSFLNCFEAKVPGLATAGDDNSACTPYDIAPAASNSAHIYYSMVLLPPGKPEVSYKDCEGKHTFPYTIVLVHLYESTELLLSL